MMDYQEGYVDGLAGKSVQTRGNRSVVEFWQYVRGLALGALDRIAMTDGWIVEWFDGLMDATAGDVMQPVQPGLWADGMGDGNG